MIRDPEATSRPPLRHVVARALLGAFVLVHLALAATSPAPWWRTAAALLLLTAAAGGTVLVPERSWSKRLDAAAVGGALLGTGVVVADLAPAGWPGYAAWPVGAATFVAIALALRFRFRAAWTLMVLLVALCTGWSLLRGAGPLPGLGLVERQVGVLLIGSLFAAGLRGALRRTSDYRAAEREQAADRIATEREHRVRREEVERVTALVQDPLERVAEGAPLSDADRAGLLALEGRLRDEISIGPLRTDGLARAVDAARIRGVQVVLLTDPALGDVPAALRRRAAGWLEARVASASAGRLVGRVVVRGDALRVSAVTDEGLEDALLR